MRITRSSIFTAVPEYESWCKVVDNKHMTFRLFHWLWFRVTDVLIRRLA